jgi:chondroitin AC lyase
VDWVFQDGIGYVFPEPLSVNIKNNEATGSWWDINKQTDSPKEEVRLDVFKLWLDHGDQPIEASYAYIVVPATTIDHLTQATSKNNICHS